MKKLLNALVVVFFAATVSGIAMAAGPALKLDPVQLNPADATSLQAGARTFVNYCLNCHGASLVRYNQLTRIGLTEAQIKENLLFTSEKIGDMMKVTATAADQRAWFGAPPPDLSLSARARGADWIYNYMRGFYKDESTPTGWNNTVYPNVGMPHVLWPMQGTRDAKVAMIDDGHGHKTKQITMAAASGGSMNAQEYDRAIVDLVNFMSWMADPSALERKRIGYLVLIGLSVLMLVTYLLKAAFWKDIH